MPVKINWPKKPPYQVGYKKPPKATQYKPGASGNPAGRPKGTKNLKTDLEEELQEKITFMEGNKQKNISRQRALVRSLVNRAIKGDSRAASLLFGHIARLLPPPEPAAALDSLGPDDLLILAAFEERIRRSLQKPEEDTND